MRGVVAWQFGTQAGEQAIHGVGRVVEHQLNGNVREHHLGALLLGARYRNAEHLEAGGQRARAEAAKKSQLIPFVLGAATAPIVFEAKPRTEPLDVGIRCVDQEVSVLEEA